jgi:hypothetical protein
MGWSTTLRDTLRPACTSWYGHDYQETRDGTCLYCRICGHVIRLTREGGRS